MRQELCLPYYNYCLQLKTFVEIHVTTARLQSNDVGLLFRIKTSLIFYGGFNLCAKREKESENSVNRKSDMINHAA